MLFLTALQSSLLNVDFLHKITWLAGLLFLCFGMVFCQKKAPSSSISPSNNRFIGQPPAQLPNKEALSLRCANCHKDVFSQWQHSHHAHANRFINGNNAVDRQAFSFQQLDTSTAQWRFSIEANTPYFAVNKQSYLPSMVIGVTPLIQYLVGLADGRWQVTSAAWSPQRKKWHSVFADSRQPGDWGHWLSAGMNWNSQCGECHMTHYQKNYHSLTDSYSTSWEEMAIGCTQCHGKITDSPRPSGCLIAQEPSQKKRERIEESCASCHSLRKSLDNHFGFGSRFANHFNLQLPTRPELYYPDGQILGEDYVFTSLKISRMGHAGVSCMDCHDPHSAQLKAPIDNGELCMTCHGSGQSPRPLLTKPPRINPQKHNHHDTISCVDCHMPQTTYMGNDPRRDHSFHIPRPRLTRAIGVPNACNRCHSNQSTQWAIDWTERWYGKSLNKSHYLHAKDRSLAIDRAFQEGETQHPKSTQQLIKMYKKEENIYWKATLLALLEPARQSPIVQALLTEASTSPHAIIRQQVARLSLQEKLLARLLKDPFQSVRLEAAWQLAPLLDAKSKELKELEKSLFFSADQPTGALRLSRYESKRNHPNKALFWLHRAIKFEPRSAQLREHAATFFAQRNELDQSLLHLKKAMELDPKNPRYPYLASLAYNQQAHYQQALIHLLKSIKLDGTNPRVYYNLALLYKQQNKPKLALQSMEKAMELNSHHPTYAYGYATLLLSSNQQEKARKVLEKILAEYPNYLPAKRALQSLR